MKKKKKAEDMRIRGWLTAWLGEGIHYKNGWAKRETRYRELRESRSVTHGRCKWEKHLPLLFQGEWLSLSRRDDSISTSSSSSDMLQAQIRDHWGGIERRAHTTNGEREKEAKKKAKKCVCILSQIKQIFMYLFIFILCVSIFYCDVERKEANNPQSVLMHF
jgi:hypothetical protein